ncbi:MAG: MraY family glycosyltransferase [Xanthomonadales bacterium]|nr:MraY family glycosyltransferase [Xanthomonadales bacterium]
MALKWNWVDLPNTRKVHEQATPVVGGVAIYIALSVAFLATCWLMPAWFQEFSWLWLGALLLLATGVVDDSHHLSPPLRFLLQICVCLIMIKPGGVVLSNFGTLFSSQVQDLGLLSVPVTLFAALGVINAFNMIDGMDGLSCSILIIAMSGMTAFAIHGGQFGSAWVLLLTLVSVAGFLMFNARFPWNPKARAFLGNSGSLLLGFVLAWFFILLGNGPKQVFMPMTAVWLFAVPLLDTSTLIWTRWRQGRSVFKADNYHLHHAFLRAGFSVEATWLAITGLALMLATIGVTIELSSLPGQYSFYVFMVVAFTYYFYLRHCWASQKFLGRHFIHHDFTVEERITR